MASLLETSLNQVERVSVLGSDVADDAAEISTFTFLPGEEISYIDIITNSEEWCLPPIRMTSQTGGTLIWQIGFNPLTNQLVRRRGYEINI